MLTLSAILKATRQMTSFGEFPPGMRLPAIHEVEPGSGEAQRILRGLCRRTHRVWVEAPWKIERILDESDADYKARSLSLAATHGLSAGGELHRLSHAPWSVERAAAPSRRWIGVRRAPRII